MAICISTFFSVIEIEKNESRKELNQIRKRWGKERVGSEGIMGNKTVIQKLLYRVSQEKKLEFIMFGHVTL